MWLLNPSDFSAHSSVFAASDGEGMAFTWNIASNAGNTMSTSGSEKLVPQ
jgi:hypothetical protein